MSELVPATRSLAVVLRDAISSGEELKLLIARAVGTKPDNAHVNVQIQGATYAIPQLVAATNPPAGAAVYVLVTPTRMVALGHVAT